jgi:hypothetical protein
MNLPYGAFGSQNWIRTVKPKAYFERRKSPAGDTGDIMLKPDYHHLRYKNGMGVELEPHENTPSLASMPWFRRTMFILIIAILVMLVWLYIKGLN